MFRKITITIAAFAIVLTSLHAQWVSEEHSLEAGWNAIYPFVDASDVTLDVLLDDSVEEVWRWNPAALDAVALDSPSEPILGLEWSTWRRGFPIDSTIDRLLPNFAYLVKVADGTADSIQTIKGRAVMPQVHWRNDGLNLVGFPAVPAPASPIIGSYFLPGELIDAQTEIFRYLGGPLTGNPVQLLNPVFQPLRRGEAMWVNTGKFSDYYGPVKVEVSLSPGGLRFGTSGTTHQLVLRNRTDRALTVTLTPTNSEPDRAGTPVDPVPLKERVFDSNTQSYTFPALTGPVQVSLEAGETTAKVIAIDRSGLTGAAGTVNASLLRVTDNEGLSRIDVPVSATVSSLSGLWVGDAAINQVQNQLQQFEREADGTYRYDDDGNRIAIAGTGDSSLHATAQTYPIRLIVHVDSAGQARLLSTVYAGPIATPVEGQEPQFGIATDQSFLDAARLRDAVRLTAVHFPLDLNLDLTGTLGPAAMLSGTVDLGHDDKVNPFIHTFHPDHDNLDARFENALPAGAESFDVSRVVTLSFDADGSASSNPAWGSTFITGVYSETISGIHKNDVAVEGPFFLRRLSTSEDLHMPAP